MLARRSFVPSFLREKMMMLSSPNCHDYEDYLYPYMDTGGRGFVDVGANVGRHTLRMARCGIQVYAFEPNPTVLKILFTKIEKYRNVEVFPYALGDEDKEAVFYMHELSGLSGIIQYDWRKYATACKVKVRKLDDFNLTDIGLIKVDTEGYEYFVLKGALQTIRREKPRIIVELHEPLYQNKRKIEGLLRPLGYKSRLICPRTTHLLWRVKEAS